MRIEVTVGADPEVFLMQGKQVVPAERFTKGTKEAPQDLGEGFSVHYDNIALEFNIPPSATLKDWKTNLSAGLFACQQVAPGVDIVMLPAMMIPLEYLKSCGPSVMQFRCDPEMNIYGDMLYKPISPELRSAGGHVHIGWGSQVPHSQQMLVSTWLDYCLGLPLTLAEPDVERSKLRRSLYGKPGSIRYKPYGVEYRTPGNEWLSNEASTELVFAGAQRAVQLASTLGTFPYHEHIEALRMAIQDSDKVLAKELLEFFDSEIQ